MLETHHHWLPIFMAIFLPVTFIITYSIAVANDHVKPGFPYISDTGTFPPESCVFGQLLNIGAVVCGMIVYIRYRHVILLFGETPGRRGLLNLNTAAFVIGLIASFGMSVVGNFQETSVIVVHLIGALMAFGVGFIYFIIQTVMSYKMVDTMPGNTYTTRIYRVVLCVLDVIFLVILGVAAPIAARKGRDGNTSIPKYCWTAGDPISSGVAAKKGPGDDEKGKDIPIYMWTSSDPGYTEHLISTISEWIIAIISVLYFSTFYQEFKHFRVTPPSLVPYKHMSLKRSNEVMHIDNGATSNHM